MTILITGASGFIGKHLTDYLSEKNSLILLGRKQKCPDCFENNKNIQYYQTDYSCNQLHAIFENNLPDAVVHLASKRFLSIENSIVDYIDNVVITSNIFDSCLKFNISNIIQASTIGVYSFNADLPWNETQKTDPHNAYGLSKLLCEQIAEFYIKKGLCIKTLRLAQLIGIGERTNYVLQIFIDNALNNKTQTVFGKQHGKRQYVYIKDVLTAIENCLGKPFENGIFNIGMQKNYSFYTLAETINKVFGNTQGILTDDQKSADEHKYLMSIERAKLKLSWEPKFDLQEAFEDMKKNKYEHQ